MTVCWRRLPTLYNMAVQTLVEWNCFDMKNLDGLPGVVKEDLLKLAMHRGKAQDHVSCFLHPSIRELCINESKISCKDLENISHCAEIRILEMNPPILQRFEHPAYALENLFSCLPQLVKLHLQRNDGVTDNVIFTISTHCPRLQELDVAGCTTLTDESAVSLSSLPNLRSVNLSQSLIGNEGLAALASGVCAMSLAELKLNSCVRIGSEGLKTVLYSCKRLSILVTEGCPKISGDYQQELDSALVENKMKQVTWTFYF